MKSENIIFVGRLLDLPSDAPRCGSEKVAVGYQFRVQKLVRGRLKNKKVVVLIPCPDFKGDDFFAVNSDYRIEVSTDLQEAGSYTIYNDYAERPVFWAVDINRA